MSASTTFRPRSRRRREGHSLRLFDHALRTVWSRPDDGRPRPGKVHSRVRYLSGAEIVLPYDAVTLARYILPHDPRSAIELVDTAGKPVVLRAGAVGAVEGL